MGGASSSPSWQLYLVGFVWLVCVVLFFFLGVLGLDSAYIRLMGHTWLFFTVLSGFHVLLITIFRDVGDMVSQEKIEVRAFWNSGLSKLPPVTHCSNFQTKHYIGQIPHINYMCSDFSFSCCSHIFNQGWGKSFLHPGELTSFVIQDWGKSALHPGIKKRNKSNCRNRSR